MPRKQRIILLSGFVLGLGVSSPSLADWTLNLGYHNPMNSRLGVNFLYWGGAWNFELGIGWLDGTLNATDDKNEADKDNDKVAFAAAGDVNLKYRFSTGGIAPYVQLGIGAATGASVGDQSGAGADLGGPFAGLGLMFGKPSFYAYVAYNISSSQDGQLQAGIGFDI